MNVPTNSSVILLQSTDSRLLLAIIVQYSHILFRNIFYHIFSPISASALLAIKAKKKCRWRARIKSQINFAISLADDMTHYTHISFWWQT